MNSKLLVSLLMIPLSCLADGARENSVAATFNEYCLAKASDFSSLSARASAEHLQVQLERDIPMPDGSVMKQKNWFIPVFGKPPMMLTSVDTKNGRRHVFGCGIYVPDVDGQGVAASLSELPRMADPVRSYKTREGATVIWWRAKVGENQASEKSEVMLSSGVPGLPGTSINLILKSGDDF